MQPGRKRAPRVEMNPEEPVMPRGVLPEEGRRFWRAVVPGLMQAGVLTKADGPALTMMALHYALVVEAAKQMRDDVTTIDERKLPRKHPAGQIVRDNSAAFRQYAGEFGMTPASRARLPESKSDHDNDLMAELFERVNAA